MRLLLDTGILGQLCHPSKRVNRPVCDWLALRLARATHDDEICVPEITFYELRRKLVHLLRKGQETTRSLDRLDRLCEHLVFLPITSEVIRAATELWADARVGGFPTADDQALDGDVILAAQAQAIDGTVVTTNRKHLERFVPTVDWTEVPTS